MSSITLSRRTLLRGAGVAGALAAVAGNSAMSTAIAQEAPTTLKGNINHSVARWTFGDLSVDELCTLVKEIGFAAIDLVGPDDWPTLQRHGVDSSMCNGAEISLEDGWAEPDNHAELIERYLRYIDLVAEAGYTNLICFSGNARGMDPEDGLKASAEGLKQIMGAAEERGVVLHMELLNSKVDHPDYLCDNSAWGIELCARIGSPNFKLLYDIYHMQIMEGDVIRTLTDNIDYFGHFHTAGNPGRNELDETQELFYPAICRAILDTGFTGYVAQEFIPSSDDPDTAAEALRAAVMTCDV
ncbi:TIM barrel protein [Pelagibacterium sp. H642]|uniref:hydroxypyruvate isomerase family protein n=1 Tax=Pelagibacterium sp. H642 TaxID=1881069 RepID=UPI0028157473|nr:TIM barrel protein [Pelagibacterium sp. H642]WMT89219.1 TIM barrel protein [Pelagibacterium sp. H642]